VFTDKPIVDDEDVTLINLGHDVFSIPKLKRVSKKCDLLLDINPNGLIKPRFRFHGKGDSISKEGALVECPEFYFSDFQIKEGNSYVGFDFGTSNSYLVRFASIKQEITAARYPEFTISNRVKERLRELELRINDLREAGVFTAKRLKDHARNQALDFIFHSNKIEGNSLSKGATEAVLSRPEKTRLSEQELEAKNSQAAYRWMLENVDTIFDQPEAFTREINSQILTNIHPGAGQYRTESVSLSGMNFTPPEATSVPAFMQQLGNEIKSRGVDRSPIEFASSVHTKLVSIHPFIDGNGRTARLLLNACLNTLGLAVLVVNYAD
jgi:fido (protein-threonine AMPylation protein)